MIPKLVTAKRGRCDMNFSSYSSLIDNPSW